MAQEAVKCQCLHCGVYLFTCLNAWSRISDEFYILTPKQPPEIPGPEVIVGQTAIQVAGLPELEDCQTCSLCCNNCTVLVGLQCLMAPKPKDQYKYVESLLGTRHHNGCGVTVLCSSVMHAVL